MITHTADFAPRSPSTLAAAALVALGLALPGCSPKPPAAATQPATPATPVPTAATPAGQPAPKPAPTAAVQAFLTDYLGEVKIDLKPAKPLPARHQAHPQEAFRASWTTGKLAAGEATVEVDQELGTVSLAILRWPTAGKLKLTDEQLRAAAVERLQHWVGAEVQADQVTPAPLHSKTRVAFLWDGRVGDHFSGARAHVVLATANGLPVSFDRYRPPETAIAPKLTAEQAVTAATAALTPQPKDFHQTDVETRLYEHSPLAKSDGPVWAVAVNGTQGQDNHKAQAGALIDAVSGEVLAPKPKATAAKKQAG